MYCRFWMLLLLLGAGACQLYDAPALLIGESRSGQDEDPHGCSSDGGVEECNGRDDDCDGETDEGDASESCAADSALSLCVAGRCEVVQCLDDARDCDGLAANGCEVMADNPQHCGGCDRPCALAHAASACQDGECSLDRCERGFGDCDAISGNGCETSLRTERNCGGCGIRCENGTSCVDGACSESEPLECTESPYAADGCGDLCPEDPDKREPGRCGCGVPDVDSDDDGTLDCQDACPNGAWTTAPCLPFRPENLDPSAIDFSNTTATVLNCGTTTLDTSASPPVLTNACGATPAISVQTQVDGSSLAVIATRGFTIAMGSSLRVIGTRPVALAVLGDALIEGTLDVSADLDVPGAGGDVACEGSTGGDGSGNIIFGAGGGGGGGFGTVGGPGGTGDGWRAGAGGAARGEENLVPLRGGCPGGYGGGCNDGAAGGGAVQLTASGRVRVTGAIRANGAEGAEGCGNEGGGGGGGSGGAILIEAHALEAMPGALEANGGRGGTSSGDGGPGSNAPTLAGSNGENNSQDGGGGGGGGYGRIRTLLH